MKGDYDNDKAIKPSNHQTIKPSNHQTIKHSLTAFVLGTSLALSTAIIPSHHAYGASVTEKPRAVAAKPRAPEEWLSYYGTKARFFETQEGQTYLLRSEKIDLRGKSVLSDDHIESIKNNKTLKSLTFSETCSTPLIDMEDAKVLAAHETLETLDLSGAVIKEPKVILYLLENALHLKSLNLVGIKRSRYSGGSIHYYTIEELENMIQEVRNKKVSRKKRLAVILSKDPNRSDFID